MLLFNSNILPLLFKIRFGKFNIEKQVPLFNLSIFNKKFKQLETIGNIEFPKEFYLYEYEISKIKSLFLIDDVKYGEIGLRFFFTEQDSWYLLFFKIKKIFRLAIKIPKNSIEEEYYKYHIKDRGLLIDKNLKAEINIEKEGDISIISINFPKNLIIKDEKKLGVLNKKRELKKKDKDHANLITNAGIIGNNVEEQKKPNLYEFYRKK